MSMLEAAILVLRANLRRVLGRHDRSDFPFGTARVLTPAEESSNKPAIFFEESAARIRACAFGADIGEALALLSGSPSQYRPTIEYIINNAFAAGNRIYCNGERKLFSLATESFEFSEFESVDEAALSSSFIGAHFFGDWLLHDCATMLLCEERFDFRFFMNMPVWPDRAVYERGFDFRFDGRSTLFCRKLVLFDDIYQNRAKIARLRALRTRIRNHYDGRPEGSGLFYIVRRASARDRTITNQDAVIAALEPLGFQTIRTEDDPDVARRLLDAQLIVSVEGSHLGHALYALRDGGGIVVIQPPERFDTAHFDWARQMDVAYGFTVGIANENGFAVDIDELLRIIDLVLERINQS
jgi:hypothetical protein